ncbi:MAG TPA: sugar ABC transporter substrate-binding protein [Bryobacteraceae bacterium]|nr:sugar ABC transporter substrate-binding protein [Bryobacteraceae bacterium]
MLSTKQLLLSAAAVCTAIAFGMVYPQHSGEELTIGTVNNADMILMQRLSKEFEKKSGIKLHWVVLGESVLRQRLTVDISTGGNTFDVITIGSYETPLWGARGWLVPMDDLGTDYQYEDIFDVIREGLSYKGKLFAAPFYGESSFTYYRKDLFARAGLEMPAQPTYDQIRSFAAKLHDPAHNVYGICLRGTPGWGQNMAYLSTMVNTFGGRWMDMEWRPQLTSPQWHKAVSFYVDLLKNYGPPGSVTDGYNEVRALFSTGNCAMWIDSTAAAGYLLDASQSRVAKTTGFAKAPIAKVPDGSAWVWGWALAVPASSKKAAMAKQFIRWATSREYVSLVGERAGWLAAPPGTRKSTYDNPAYQQAAPFARLTRDAILNANITKPSALPVPYVGIQYVGIPEFQAIGTEVGQEISAALTGGVTVEQALQLAQAETESQLRQSGYLK